MPYVSPNNRNYFNKQVSSYIYCLDEKKAVKIFLSTKYNIDYSSDEILHLMIKKYKKLNISASDKIPNLLEFITGLDTNIQRIRFELGLHCDIDFGLDRLPYNLTTLSIVCEKLTVELTNLPLTLLNLQIKCMNTYDFPLDYLPYNLHQYYHQQNKVRFRIIQFHSIYRVN